MSADVLAASRQVMARHARTFNRAAWLLPRQHRADAAVVYAFCRLVDDTADEADDAAGAAIALDALRAELAADRPPRPLVATFRATAARLGLPLQSAVELIAGVRSDLGTVRVRDDTELLRYCYRVAGTVGLMMCSVLRVRSADGYPHAVDLGIAMQLTNIARDVAEDAARNRVYLPAARLLRAGCNPDSLCEGGAEPDRVALVVGEVLALADRFYRSADLGMRHIPWRARHAILFASRAYRGIGVRLARRGCDALAGRTIVPAYAKAGWGVVALAAACRPDIMGMTAVREHDRALHQALAGFPGTNSNGNGHATGLLLFDPLNGSGASGDGALKVPG